MKALVALLRSLFSVDELRRFVALLPGKNLSAELPGGSVSLAALTFEVVGVLVRHKRLDDSFFELLEQERPARQDEIARVRALILRSMTPATPPPVPSTRRNPGAAARLDPLAQKIEQVLARKRRLESMGQPTDDILAELRQLKREHRRGGQLRRGDALGERYLLTEQIGRGGIATVWRARNGASGDEVAIKVLHPELAGDTIRRQRFFRGARIMAELAHPLVVSIREREAEDDGFFYFVMDFVPGGNLQDAVLEQRVDREHAVPIILGIGQALAEAHRRGHAHRDVKPVNILLTGSGEPRLTDFDLVTGTDTTGGTRTGALGTFIYAAPEMMDRPQDADARADVYALGMTMAFILHGDKLPRKALTARERFIENLRATPTIKAVLKRATAEDLEDRYPDAAAFCDALRAAIPLVIPPVSPVAPSARPGWLLPGALLLPVIAIVVGIWATGREAPEASPPLARALETAEADSCLDEVGCLLAEKPPACCSKYSGGGSGARASDTLSRSEITAGVGLVRARVLSCSGKGSGEVKLTVYVAAQSGLVEDVTVKSAPNAALGTCAANAMKHATFAKGKQRAIFTYPFVF